MICGAPAEAILRASELPSAPASALREVTHAADSRADGQTEYELVRRIVDSARKARRTVS
jgi:hypothetical protein